MAHKYRLVKEYRETPTGKRRLNSVTVIHTGRGGRRILGVESALKRAVSMAEEDRTDLILAHIQKHPNDKRALKKYGVKIDG